MMLETLVLLEQLERALAREHRVRKLNLNHTEKAFLDYVEEYVLDRNLAYFGHFERSGPLVKLIY